MNKAIRHEIKQRKYKQRLKNYGLTEGKGNFHAFKTTGKPCSCLLCSPEKYSRKQKHRDKLHFDCC